MKPVYDIIPKHVLIK